MTKDEKVKKNRIRYNLHYRIRKQGFKLKTSLKTIYVAYGDITFPKQTLRLRNEFNYAIQIEML